MEPKGYIVFGITALMYGCLLSEFEVNPYEQDVKTVKYSQTSLTQYLITWTHGYQTEKSSI